VHFNAMLTSRVGSVISAVDMCTCKQAEEPSNRVCFLHHDNVISKTGNVNIM
jgi:hypothetical protein